MCMANSCLRILLLLLIATAISTSSRVSGSDRELGERPNVILIITDDQGYGDLGCHGNKMLRTPKLDALSRESHCLTNFHVDPTCSETRSALLTGRYSTRTGVWHTIMGRSILRRDEVTMADIFKANGYATGMFGKWHLGDNFPFRPQDRGFEEVLCHGGGGVGQTPDYWGNDYFDDTYFRDGVPEPQEGYCTDVFFAAATEFIESHQDSPFFCYLATNAAHGPFLVADRYARPYLDQGVSDRMSRFYGMIANIDENVGRLRERLQQLGLDRKTLLIFMTDNGTAAGIESNPNDQQTWTGYNADMRGRKGSQYEGGHRVPCLIYGPELGIKPRKSDRLCAHFDLLPTFVDLCGLDVPNGLQFDGRALTPTLRQKAEDSVKPRTLFVHSQRIDLPEYGRKSAVMTQQWRLVDLHELYDMRQDPGQTTDVAERHPDVVQDLKTKYDQWWQSISARFDEYVEIDLGALECPKTILTAHDWHPTQGGVPWNQGAISRDVNANGFWAVRVQQEGTYRFTLASRPLHVRKGISEQPGQARVKIGDASQSKDFAAKAKSVQIEMRLEPGSYQMQTWIEPLSGKSRGAYFVTVEYLGNN